MIVVLCGTSVSEVPLSLLQYLPRSRSLMHHRIRVLNSNAVRTAIFAEDAHQIVVVILMRPIALKLNTVATVVIRTAPACVMRDSAAT